MSGSLSRRQMLQAATAQCLAVAAAQAGGPQLLPHPRQAPGWVSGRMTGAVALVETLIAEGFAASDSRLGGYQVTSKVAALSSGFHGAPMVIEAARPWAIDLTRKLKWPAAVAVLQEDAVFVRFSTIPDSPVSPFHATINLRLSLISRALGRALRSPRSPPP